MAFCDTCRDHVHYTTHKVRKVAKIKGFEISYTGKEARCIDCINVIFVHVVHDYNLIQINKKYFKARNIQTNLPMG